MVEDPRITAKKVNGAILPSATQITPVKPVDRAEPALPSKVSLTTLRNLAI